VTRLSQHCAAAAVSPQNHQWGILSYGKNKGGLPGQGKLLVPGDHAESHSRAGVRSNELVLMNNDEGEPVERAFALDASGAGRFDESRNFKAEAERFIPCQCFWR
jgi:hypothetical protein